ncbi:MAG: nucleoside monophosphate kinase [Aureliella sp.]
MAHIVFIGPPGSGKGTQSRKLAAKLGLPHLSTGELLREIIAEDTALSRWLAERLDRGHFAPDHMVMRMVTDWIEDPRHSGGSVLDGFPRTVEQAAAIDGYFAGEVGSVDLVLLLAVPTDHLIERLQARGREQNRADDNLASIEERMRVYELQTAPVVRYYREQGRLEEVDGLGSPDEVSKQVNHIAKRVLSSDATAGMTPI